MSRYYSIVEVLQHCRGITALSRYYSIAIAIERLGIYLLYLLYSYIHSYIAMSGYYSMSMYYSIDIDISIAKVSKDCSRML